MPAVRIVLPYYKKAGSDQGRIRRVHMSKRRKVLIILLVILVIIYFLLIGVSYIFLKLFVYPALEPRRMIGAYPYSDAAIPDDFAEYSAAG